MEQYDQFSKWKFSRTKVFKTTVNIRKFAEQLLRCGRRADRMVVNIFLQKFRFMIKCKKIFNILR